MRHWFRRSFRACSAQAYYAVALLGACIFCPPLHATITNVQLATSPSTPQLLGTTITLTASATDSDPGPLSYKWEVERPGATTYSTLEDFDEANTFTWVLNYVEGAYHLRLTARDYLAGTSAQVVILFVAQPLVTGSRRDGQSPGCAFQFADLSSGQYHECRLSIRSNPPAGIYGCAALPRGVTEFLYCRHAAEHYL